MSLFFIRHGESEANVEKYFAGQSDVSLTAFGQQQASQEAQRLRAIGESFDVILSSELGRAYQTALPIAKATNYPIEAIVTTQLLNERCGGKFEGRPVSEFFALTEEEQVTGGAESFKELGERANRLLEYVEGNYPEQKVLLVSHATFGEMLQALLKYDDYTKVLDGEKISNAVTIQMR